MQVQSENWKKASCRTPNGLRPHEVRWRPAPTSLLLQPSDQILEDPQSVLGVLGGKRGALGMRHEAEHEAAFIGNAGDGAGGAVRIARIVHGGLAVFVPIIENGTRRG